VSREEIVENIRQRDHLDQTRTISPLRKADDAIVLDNGGMTLEEEMEWFDQVFKLKIEN
jgi:cytidylate kinase